MNAKTTQDPIDNAQHRDAAADVTTDAHDDAHVDDRERRGAVRWIRAEDLIVMTPPQKRTEVAAEVRSNATWLNYREAARYIGYSVAYVRNLVSADSIPVYGPPRSRRFRCDMLDLFLTNRDAAMRKFRLERSSHHGE